MHDTSAPNDTARGERLDAVVDRLLGYDRMPEEGRLQVTPVEWGILTFAVAETLARLEGRAGVLGPWDFTLDRVGPDLFDSAGLGAIVTVRWPVRIGPITGSVRLWLPETLFQLAAAAEPHADLAGLFEAAALMPWMPGIWIREIVSEGGHLRERMLRHFPVAAANRLADAVARDQREGKVPAGVEPKLAFLSIAGAALLPLAVRAVWGRLPGLGDLTERQLEAHAIAVLTAGLAPAHRGRSP